MISKPALVPSVLYLGATVVLLYFSCKILATKDNEKEGLVLLSLSLGKTRRDLFGSVQSIASQATDLGGVASTLVPEITGVAGGVVSQVTAAVSNVVSAAASLETSVLGQIFASNYTVGTKYACAASSCDQIPSLEVVLCFGVFITLVSAIAFASAFFLPFMRFFTLGLSMLTMLFFIVFAACVVSIVEVASLVAGSTFFHAEKGGVFAESLWALGGAIVLVFSAVGMLFVSPRQASSSASADTQARGSSRTVPTWARPTQRNGIAETTDDPSFCQKENDERTGSSIVPSLSEQDGDALTGSTIASPPIEKERD